MVHEWSRKTATAHVSASAVNPHVSTLSVAKSLCGGAQIPFQLCVRAHAGRLWTSWPPPVNDKLWHLVFADDAILPP